VSALATLRRAREAGVTLTLQGARVDLAASFPPCVELLEALREHKAEIVEILNANRCRLCGEPMAWPGPVGVTLADGTAECMACFEGEAWRILAAADRAVNSPAALADEAEVMIRGEIE
jgi:hypothetical protein